MPGRSKQPIWIIPLAIAVVVALLGWWGNYRLRDGIEADLKADLTSTLNANVTALEIWTTNQMRMATTLAAEPTVRTLAGRILNEPLAHGDLPPTQDAIDLGNYLRPRLGLMGYEIAQLVNTNYFNRRTFHPQPVRSRPASFRRMRWLSAELFTSDQPIIITPFKPDLLLERRPLPGGNKRQPEPLQFCAPPRRRDADDRWRRPSVRRDCVRRAGADHQPHERIFPGPLRRTSRRNRRNLCL